MTKLAPRTGQELLDWCKKQVGKAYPPNLCAQWVIRDALKIPPPWKWGGNGRPWAINYALASKKVVRTTDPNKIPRGAIGFLTGGGSRAGHIFVSRGDGYCYSTDAVKNGEIGIAKISTLCGKWNLKVWGYVVEDGMGYTLYEQPAPAPTFHVKVAQYKVVTANAPLNGRDKPSFDGKVVTQLANGAVFTSAGYLTDNNGYLWIQRNDSVWFSGAYLDLVPEKPKRTIKIPIMLMPMAGYNPPDAPGVKKWKSNVSGALTLVTEHKPTLLGVTEMSAKAPVEMRDAFDAGARAYGRYGGSDGRYPYVRNSQIEKHLQHGTRTAKARFNKDDKQMGYRVDVIDGVPISFGIAHAENQNGIDKHTGKSADDIRVEQAVEWADWIDGLVAKHGGFGILMGDFNSQRAVRDKLVKKGWKAIKVGGRVTGWDHIGGPVADWIFVKHGVLATTVKTNKYSDHTYVVGTWTLTV